jgi:ankyrin repeat protein
MKINIKPVSLKVFLLLFCIVSSLSANAVLSDTDSIHYVSGDNDYNLIVASYKGDYSIVEELLKKGVNVNTTLEDGTTPLIYAAQGGQLSIIKLLINNGAEIDYVPHTVSTALITAVKFKQHEIVKYLIEKGASVNLQNDAGQTPLIYAAYVGDSILCDILLSHGGKLDIKDESGIDPLIAAVTNSQDNLIGFLINKGSDVNTFDNAGVTPFMISIGKNDLKAADLLLKYGADINHLSKHKETALTIAIKNNDEALVSYLIKKGADVNKKLTSAETPLTIAYYYKKDQFVIETLENNGAKQNKLPDFRRIMFGPEVSFNFDDLMLGLSLGCKEFKYKLDITSGFIFRPYATRVLRHDSANFYSQFWEKRSFAYLGINKNFDFSRNKNGLFIGIKEIYTFGSYRGTSLKAEKTFIPVAEIGLYQYFRGVQINLGYQYMDFKTEGVSPSRIDLSIKIIFGSGSSFGLNSYSLW